MPRGHKNQSAKWKIVEKLPSVAGSSKGIDCLATSCYDYMNLVFSPLLGHQ
jgi:hypothetical protein